MRARRSSADPRILLVSCYGDSEPQFRGILTAATELLRRGRIMHARAPLPCNPTNPEQKASEVILCGHGSPDSPQVGTARIVTPAELRPFAPLRVYLLCCHQGRRDIRSSWASGSGLPVERVMGHAEETESALSTMFVTHLLYDKPPRLDELFEQWRRANSYLAPWFSFIRSTYQDTKGDALATMLRVEQTVDLSPVRPYVEVVRSFPRYFDGLI